MPALGESVTEGTVTRWLKQVGDQVEVDEPLLEVSTDKVDTEIPSPVAGTLQEILVAEDETVEVGAELARHRRGGDGAGAPADGDGQRPPPTPRHRRRPPEASAADAEAGARQPQEPRSLQPDRQDEPASRIRPPRLPTVAAAAAARR